MSLTLMPAGAALEYGRTYFAIVNLLGLEALAGTPADVRDKLMAAGFRSVVVSDNPIAPVPTRTRFKNGSTLWARGVYAGKPGPLALPKQVKAVWAGGLSVPRDAAAAAAPPVGPKAGAGGAAVLLFLAATLWLGGLLWALPRSWLPNAWDLGLSRIDGGRGLRFEAFTPGKGHADHEGAQAVQLPTVARGRLAAEPQAVLAVVVNVDVHPLREGAFLVRLQADRENPALALVFGGWGRFGGHMACLLPTVLPRAGAPRGLVVPSKRKRPRTAQTAGGMVVNERGPQHEHDTAGKRTGPTRARGRAMLTADEFEAAVASLITVGHTKGLPAGEASEVYLAAAIRIARSCGLGTVEEFKEAVDIMWMSNGRRVIHVGGGS